MKPITAFIVIMVLITNHLPSNAESFIGPVTGKEIYFRIILPENYNLGTERYPVIYHLHGKGSNPDKEGQQWKPIIDSAIKARVIRPVIMVFASGYRDSFWADSYLGDKPAATNIICELIPYIDFHYRTIPTRDFRVIQGWSMGGFGAMMYMTKFYSLFSIGVIYDGVLLSYDAMMERNSNILQTNFNMNRDYFNRFCPWENLRKNADRMKEIGVSIKIVAGIKKEKEKIENIERYRDLLLDLGFQPEFSEVPCEHRPSCVYGYEAHKGLHFIEEHLGKGLRQIESVPSQ